MKQGLRTKLTSRILAIGLTGSLLTAAIVLIVAQSTVSLQVRDRLQTVARSSAQALVRWVAERREDVVYAAASEEFGQWVGQLIASDDPELASHLIERLRRLGVGSGQFEEVVIELPDDSRVLLSTGGTRAGSYTDYPVYLDEGARGPYASNVYTSRVDGRPRMTVAAPIRVEGEVVAVLAGHLDLRFLGDLFAPDSTEVDEVIYPIAGEAGDFIFAEGFGIEELGPGLTSYGIQQGLQRSIGVENYQDYRGRPVLGAWHWIDEHAIVLMVEGDASEALGPARRLAALALIAGLFASGLVLMASRSVARDVAAPLEALADSTAQLSAGDLQIELPDLRGAGAEVSRLAHTFQGMIDRLDYSYQQLETQVSLATDALEDAESSRLLLQSIVDNSTSLIGVCSAEGEFQLANRLLVKLCGVDSLVGLELEEALGPRLGRLGGDLLRRALEEDRVVETEFSAEVDGTTRHFFAIVFPLRGTATASSSVSVGFIALDRTERVQAEATRVELEGQLQHAQKLGNLNIPRA